MKSSSAFRKVTGFLFVAVTGTVLHFLYDLTGRSILASLVSAVNESIWEHMKLIFYPMLLFSLAEIRYGSGDKSVIRCSTMAETLLALLLIPVMYYTYTGSMGISADWFNVTIFFLSAGAACYLGYRMEAHHFTCRIRPEVWAAGMVLIAVLFTAATFRPPRIPLFRDPVTGTYGIFGIV